MYNLKNIGRIIFAVPFVVFGLTHLMMANKMGGMVPSFIPGGVFWVYLTGFGMIAASISILINKVSKFGALLLGVLLLIFVFTIHLPGLFNPQMWQMSLGGLLKDTAMAGAAIFLSGYFSDEKKLV